MIKSCDWFSGITRQVNALFVNKEPWQVASITAVSLMTTIWIWEQINHDESKSFTEIINRFSVFFPFQMKMCLLSSLQQLVHERKKSFSS